MRIKSTILIILIFCCPILILGETLFISSVPFGAKISILKKNKDKKEKIIPLGKTPLKTTNFTEKTTLIIEKTGYVPTTNQIKSSTELQNCVFTLAPKNFNIQFPNQENSLVYVNGKYYTSLNGSIILPYGNYDIDYNIKKEALMVDYKSPNTPYVAFFTTATIVSIALVITGGILGNRSFQDFQQATNANQILNSLGQTSTWESIMWSGVGIGTGALIGTAISGALLARDNKRIKRFNGMNAPTRDTQYLSDYQEISILYQVNTLETLEKINEFIKKYPVDDSPFYPDVLFKRATLWNKIKNYRRAIQDLKTIINDFPTRDSYEEASKLLGDIYYQQEDYLLAYQSYQDVLTVIELYSYNDLKMDELTSLYELSLKKPRYKKLFLTETSPKLLKKLSENNRLLIEDLRSEQSE